MTVKEGLQAALAALGPNGENWSKGNEEGIVGEGYLCAMTATGKVAGVRQYTPPALLFLAMRRALEAQLPPETKTSPDLNVVTFNDDAATTFADVKALFERAIEAA